MARTKAASLADELVRSFEGRIQRGDMAPGDRFPTEMAVVADHGVSRTVVREAFARLAARGLLESRRGSGAYVARDARYTAFQIPPDQVQAVDDVLKLLEMRRGLEAEMAMLAAERRSDADLARMRACMTAMEESRDVDASIAADAAFHAAIAHATDNEYYVRFTEFLGVRLVPSRRLYLQSDAPDQHRAYAHAINLDHAAIYRAIEAASPERARLAARRHMDKSAERYRSLKDDAAGR